MQAQILIGRDYGRIKRDMPLGIPSVLLYKTKHRRAYVRADIPRLILQRYEHTNAYEVINFYNVVR